MTPKQSESRVYPLLFPILLITILMAISIFFLDWRRSWFTLLFYPFVAYRFYRIYQQYKKGNGEPLEKVVLGSKVVIITMMLLAAIHYIFKWLPIL